MDNNDRDKKLSFSISTDDHVKLRIKLQYDKMSQTMLFNYFLKGYLEEHPLIKQYMNEIAEKRLFKKTYAKRIKEQTLEKENIKNFGLNKEEIENIFDIIENESE